MYEIFQSRDENEEILQYYNSELNYEFSSSGGGNIHMCISLLTVCIIRQLLKTSEIVCVH